jgi:hypothetical protein
MRSWTEFGGAGAAVERWMRRELNARRDLRAGMLMAWRLIDMDGYDRTWDEFGAVEAFDTN